MLRVMLASVRDTHLSCIPRHRAYLYNNINSGHDVEGDASVSYRYPPNMHSQTWSIYLYSNINSGHNVEVDVSVS